MNNLLYTLIILNMIVLTGYLCSPIEYMSEIDLKEVKNIYEKRLGSDKLKTKINRINTKCKNKGVHNEKCRQKYLNICEENAEDYVCTLYNKNTKLIGAKICGNLGAGSQETLKSNIISSCEREVDDVDGYYLTNDSVSISNDRDYKPLSSAFGQK